MTPDTLSDLYRRHAPALRLYARQWDGGDDVVQEAFVQLAGQSRPPEQPVPWLYAVVRRAAMAAGRSAARRKRREAVAGTPEAWFASADDAIDAQRATELLATLPIEQREIIVARLWGGLTFDEAARLCGCSLPTAHRRYQAGLSELRRRMDECPRTS